MRHRKKIILIRHPEAQKNKEDRHGGTGTSLTKLGVIQAEVVAKHLKNFYSHLRPCFLVGHNVPQVEECIKYITDQLNIEPIWDDRLRGINLGVLAGLSREEAATKWPAIASRLDLWRRGELNVDKLDIPNGEPISEFKKRIEKMLLDWVDMEKINLIIAVCTRSVLIMLINLVKLGDEFTYKRYRVYNLDAASITTIDVSKFSLKIINVNQVDHLYDIK